MKGLEFTNGGPWRGMGRNVLVPLWVAYPLMLAGAGATLGLLFTRQWAWLVLVLVLAVLYGVLIQHYLTAEIIASDEISVTVRTWEKRAQGSSGDATPAAAVEHSAASRREDEADLAPAAVAVVPGASPPPAPPPRPFASPRPEQTSADVATRLRQLEDLREQGLVTEAEYSSKRVEVLRSL